MNMPFFYHVWYLDVRAVFHLLHNSHSRTPYLRPGIAHHLSQKTTNHCTKGLKHLNSVHIFQYVRFANLPVILPRDVTCTVPRVTTNKRPTFTHLFYSLWTKHNTTNSTHYLVWANDVGNWWLQLSVPSPMSGPTLKSCPLKADKEPG
jgi:hypothetical protein